MERLTSREPRISGLPGVCCTHFTASECQTLGGCCTEGCPWEDAAWERLAAYEDIGLTPEEIRERLDAGEKLFFERVNIYELFQAKKDGRTPVTPKAKTYDAHAAEAEYLLGVLWNGLHNTDGMDARAADRVAEIAHEGDRLQPTTTPKNDPLTLEELRGMDGEPVCITPAGGGKYVWMLVDEKYEVCRDAYGCLVVFENLGKTWLAYRQRPENGGRE